MTRIAWFRGVLSAGAFLLATAAYANDMRINVEESGRQDEAAIAHQSTGEAFIVWEGATGGILGRRFAADGTAIDNNDLVIADTGTLPHVDMNDSGQAVVAWQTVFDDPDVMARIVPFDGSPASDPFQVNLVTTRDQQRVSVTVSPGGNFHVVYESSTIDGNGSGIVLRSYSADGAAQTGEVIVNSIGTEDNQNRPVMARNSSGDFVVAWRDFADSRHYIRYFDANGMPTTDPAQVAGDFDHDIAYSDQGQVLVAYGFFGISAALYDNEGNFVDSFRVDEQGAGTTKATVTALASGNFQVAWSQEPSGSSDKDIYTRTVLADGTMPDPPERANRITGGTQAQAHIAAGPNNGYTIVFQGPDMDNLGIFATCMQPDGCIEVFSDGFESGDVASWSGSMP